MVLATHESAASPDGALATLFEMATTGRDYYEILGVARSAPEADIKRAFRRLARELHPDVSTEPDADERFKEIVEAYEVLSKSETRQLYDRFGHEPRGLRLLARGRVLVERAVRCGAVDPPLQRRVLVRDLILVAGLDGSLQPPRDRLDRRAVAEVVQPVLGGGSDALLLLLDVRHLKETPANMRARRWYQSPRVADSTQS